MYISRMFVTFPVVQCTMRKLRISIRKCTYFLYISHIKLNTFCKITALSAFHLYTRSCGRDFSMMVNTRVVFFFSLHMHYTLFSWGISFTNVRWFKDKLHFLRDPFKTVKFKTALQSLVFNTQMGIDPVLR